MPEARAPLDLGSNKITSLANGTASTDGAAFGQTPAGGNTVTIGQGGTGQITRQLAMNALSPTATLGDTLYEDGVSGVVALSGNTTATKNFLTQTGTGSASAAPGWGTIASADMPSGTTSAKGALQLDGTAADIQPPGTQGAGTGSLAAISTHVHPAQPNLWVPADNGWLIANGIIETALSAEAIVAGTLYLFKWKVTAPVTISRLVFLVSNAGSWSTTVAAGSNGGEISNIAAWTSPSAGVLDVASTAGWPSSGTVTVATTTTPATVTYTGTAAGQFTGCAYVSGSATGTVATGGAVTNASPSGSYIGLFSSSGTLLTGSSDISSSFTGGGWQNPALTTPQALTAGTYVWAALLLNMATMPHLWGYDMTTTNLLNANLGAGAYRFAVNGTGLTSPTNMNNGSNITPSSNTNTGTLPCFCAGY